MIGAVFPLPRKLISSYEIVMSRWVEEFENHAFRTPWEQITEYVNEFQPDTETDTTVMSEMRRLQKVVEYINGLIESIDPELVPLITWQNFNNQSVQCQQHLEQYNRSCRCASLLSIA